MPRFVVAIDLAGSRGVNWGRCPGLAVRVLRLRTVGQQAISYEDLWSFVDAQIIGLSDLGEPGGLCQMRVRRAALLIAGIVMLTAMFFSTGCSYMENRGNDALDFLDLGITVSKKPGFSLYVGLVNVVTLGYSNVDGTLLGTGGRDVGALPMRHNAGGVLLWGYEQLGYVDFDPEDPDSPPSWRVGIIGLAQGPGPDKHETGNCPKLFHLGWVGFALNCHFYELADFLLGWANLDIMGDDS